MPDPLTDPTATHVKELESTLYAIDFTCRAIGDKTEAINLIRTLCAKHDIQAIQRQGHIPNAPNAVPMNA